MENKKPKLNLKSGQLQLCVWENPVTKNGNTFTRQAITCVKSYKDGDTWKTTTTFSPEDLPKLRLLIEQAYARLLLKDE